MQIAKIYQFKLLPGASEATLLQTSKNLDQKLLQAEGFLYRSMSKAESGEWSDIVYWENEESAGKAQKLMDLADFSTFMSLIDQESLTAKATEIRSSVYPEMEMA